MDQTFTVSEIAKLVGEKPRTIQFWADVGVLRAEGGTNRTGKGVHRKFGRAELDYARVARMLAALNSPIGEIEKVIVSIRSIDILDTFEALGNRLVEMANLGRAALEGKSVTRFTIWNEEIDIIGRLGISGGFEGAIYIIIVYYKYGNEIESKIRFWSEKTMAAFRIDTWASLAVHDFIGFKAIRFPSAEDITFHLRDIPGEGRAEIKRFAQKTLADVLEMLVGSMGRSVVSDIKDARGRTT